MTDAAQIIALGQVVRTVRDIAAATAWYRDVLGLDLLYSFEGMAFFDLGGTRLYLQQSVAAGPESILYFRVTDIEAAHVRLVARGVHFTQPPRRIHQHADGLQEWMAFLSDPDERPLALMEQRPG
jgi:catechol 2,3-dioxygenase-like lactoylglutathione lyase family enzyme